MLKVALQFIKNNLVEIIVIIFSLALSIWLMFSTFSYSHGYMLIASKAYSDFSANIPLIRSFSYGNNFPVQYPLFSGFPIHYHFLFYLAVGILEKIGFRIDIALNLLSTFGFFALLILIYYLAKQLFLSKMTGVLSVLFFIFNGSLSFIYFFAQHPLSKNSIIQIIQNQKFPSFAPYGPGLVSAFWNLNIYTNQRHLAGAFGLSLIIIYLALLPVLKNKKIKLSLYIILGIILGLSYFFHMAVFLMTVIVLFSLSILFKKTRIPLLFTIIIAGIIALPQYLYMNSSGGSFKLAFNPGYLISNNFTFFNFINYWFWNFGLHLLLMPIGFILAPKNLKKIFLAFFPLFLIGNLFQFSPEIAANHKFFNYFMVIGVMFSAYSLVLLWKKNIITKIITIVLIFFLIFSGIIDFFPVYNDSKIQIADYPVNKDILWIMKNTPKDSVFLNTDYLYDNASLAGRKIFLGWPYFAWSAGYDTNLRGQTRDNLLLLNNKSLACSILKRNKINYLELEINPNNTIDVPKQSDMYRHFTITYNNTSANYKIINVAQNCNYEN